MDTELRDFVVRGRVLSLWINTIAVNVYAVCCMLVFPVCIDIGLAYSD